ncbi:HlyD family efflux transporter periplasmic adaptor subunit [Murdochiella vaginalis]|uniref:HlyD family efflux transporter periplasmic adaptor subunit n=1 Tax=Murdochiella vaginalis TaxID=1852373 RepID=UPI0008FE8F0F|nr:HlyD family efflux transporter periplasmic adaptor subunit [Murdochiella vaginalis]
MPTEVQQKTKRRFPVLRLLILLLFAFLLFIFVRRVWNSKTVTLVQSERVEQSREGRGVFVYYEYAPDVFQHVDWPKETMNTVNTEIRYRVDTPLFKLDEALRRRVESQATRLAGSAEEEYLQKMLKADAVLTPFSCMASFVSDGYESLFTPQSLSLLQPGDLGTENKNQEHAGLKFLDNRLFYLVLDLPQSVLPLDVKLGEDYTLVTDKDVTLHGKIIRRSDDSLGRSLLIFSLRDGVLRVRGERFSTIRLVLSQAECYRLPESAIFYEGAETFCYVLDKNHVAKKVAIHLMGSDKETGEFFVAGGDDDANEAALHRFDRVILRPQEVKEGGLYR